MCASYGLGGGDTADRLPDGLPPLSEKADYTRLAEWIADRDGRARITGPRALNLNPLLIQRDNGLHVELGWWSLWIGGQLRKGYSTFNARDDKLISSPWWRGPFKASRALIPATWYVEKGRRFRLPDGAAFTIAALYNTTIINDQPTVTYTMVTRSSVAQAATVHPRMPLIIPTTIRDTWLDGGQPGDAGLLALALDASTASSEAVA